MKLTREFECCQSVQAGPIEVADRLRITLEHALLKGILDRISDGSPGAHAFDQKIRVRLGVGLAQLEGHPIGVRLLACESQIGASELAESAFGIGFLGGYVVTRGRELRESLCSNRGENFILVMEIAVWGRTAAAQLVGKTAQTHTGDTMFGEAPGRGVAQAASKDFNLIFAQGRSTHLEEGLL